MRILGISGGPAAALFFAAGLATLPVCAATITVSDTGDTIAVDAKLTLREAMTSIVNGSNVSMRRLRVGILRRQRRDDFAIGNGFQGSFRRAAP